MRARKEKEEDKTSIQNHIEIVLTNLKPRLIVNLLLGFRLDLLHRSATAYKVAWSTTARFVNH